MPLIRHWVDSYNPIFDASYAKGMTDHAISVAFEQQGYRVSTWMVEQHRKALGLPKNTQHYFTDDQRPFKSRPDPLAIAQLWVPGFDRAKMTRDGKPIRLDEVMRLANRALATNELPMITVNENWIPQI